MSSTNKFEGTNAFPPVPVLLVGLVSWQKILHTLWSRGEGLNSGPVVLQICSYSEMS